MGTELSAICECGFRGLTHIGSSRAQHGKTFKYPHYCDACNSLTSVDLLCKPPSCSKCSSSNVHTYASHTSSLSYDSIFNKLPTKYLRFLGFNRRDEAYDESFCYPLKKTFVLLRGKNYCPKCRNASLIFSVERMYD